MTEESSLNELCYRLLCKVESNHLKEIFRLCSLSVFLQSFINRVHTLNSEQTTSMKYLIIFITVLLPLLVHKAYSASTQKDENQNSKDYDGELINPTGNASEELDHDVTLILGKDGSLSIQNEARQLEPRSSKYSSWTVNVIRKLAKKLGREIMIEVCQTYFTPSTTQSPQVEALWIRIINEINFWIKK